MSKTKTAEPEAATVETNQQKLNRLLGRQTDLRVEIAHVQEQLRMSRRPMSKTASVTAAARALVGMGPPVASVRTENHKQQLEQLNNELEIVESGINLLTPGAREEQHAINARVCEKYRDQHAAALKQVQAAAEAMEQAILAQELVKRAATEEGCTDLSRLKIFSFEHLWGQTQRAAFRSYYERYQTYCDLDPKTGFRPVREWESEAERKLNIAMAKKQASREAAQAAEERERLARRQMRATEKARHKNKGTLVVN